MDLLDVEQGWMFIFRKLFETDRFVKSIAISPHTSLKVLALRVQVVQCLDDPLRKGHSFSKGLQRSQQFQWTILFVVFDLQGLYDTWNICSGYILYYQAVAISEEERWSCEKDVLLFKTKTLTLSPFWKGMPNIWMLWMFLLNNTKFLWNNVKKQDVDY